MRRITPVTVVWVFLATLTYSATPVTHQEFQAVDAEGKSLFIKRGIAEVSIEGILLNCPEQWVDPTPNSKVAPFFMGGEWEFFILGEGDDHAGTACWIGQNYNNLPWGDEGYTQEEWLAELNYLNRDPNTGYIFRPGDRVRITGRYLWYQGKLNINEQHNISPSNDFWIDLIEPAVGLPQPESVTLSDLKDEFDQPIFDPQRLSGPEFYQARLVRIEDVNVIDPDNWGIKSNITVQDKTGRTFPVHLCRGTGISQHSCPEGQVDVVGIMDQKSIDGTKGYRLLVLNYDGNGLVLGNLTTQRGNLIGDLNGDFKVDEKDQAILEAHLGQSVPGLAQE